MPANSIKDWHYTNKPTKKAGIAITVDEWNKSGSLLEIIGDTLCLSGQIKLMRAHTAS